MDILCCAFKSRKRSALAARLKRHACILREHDRILRGGRRHKRSSRIGNMTCFCRLVSKYSHYSLEDCNSTKMFYPRRKQFFRSSFGMASSDSPSALSASSGDVGAFKPPFFDISLKTAFAAACATCAGVAELRR